MLLVKLVVRQCFDDFAVQRGVPALCLEHFDERKCCRPRHLAGRTPRNEFQPGQSPISRVARPHCLDVKAGSVDARRRSRIGRGPCAA